MRFALLVLGIMLVSAPAGAGGLYKYIDDRGVVHFSDIPFDARYRRIVPREFGVSMAPMVRPDLPVNHGYDGMIYRMAREMGVEPALVKAVVAAESNFKVDAESRAGAQGLMQLMPATAREMDVKAPLTARENLQGGTRYLRAMLDRYGDVSRALAAYNAGPAAVDRYGGIPPYPETEAYVARVLTYYRGYQGQFAHR
jgi:soluble lytic murein transglycosylase